MAYYNTCMKCGCNLDPGEKCDCGIEEGKKKSFFSRHLKKEPGAGQMVFDFDKWEEGHGKKMCI